MAWLGRSGRLFNGLVLFLVSPDGVDAISKLENSQQGSKRRLVTNRFLFILLTRWLEVEPPGGHDSGYFGLGQIGLQIFRATDQLTIDEHLRDSRIA